jgi:hypothetical protein
LDTKYNQEPAMQINSFELEVDMLIQSGYQMIALLAGKYTSILIPIAYIDPTSGGMLFQLLAVLFALFSGFILFFSRQIKTVFARIKRFLGNFWKE